MAADAGAEPAVLARNRPGSQARRDGLTQPRLAPVGTDVCGQALKVQGRTFSSSSGPCTAASPTRVGLSLNLSGNDAYPRPAEDDQTLKNLDCF